DSPHPTPFPTRRSSDLVPDGTTSWDDAVHGRIEFANRDIEDFIILRSDGTAVYNMAVVSDDAEMAITHVIRGDDHISNTPKQILDRKSTRLNSSHVKIS